MEKIISNNENMNEVQNQSVNPNAEGEIRQASAGASPVSNNDEFTPTLKAIWQSSSEMQESSPSTPANNTEKELTVEKTTSETQKDDSEKKAKAKKEKGVEYYTPTYTEVEIEELTKITILDTQERERIGKDSRYGVLRDYYNQIIGIDITFAKKNGVKFYRPKMNREHGTDKKKTGESIMRHGAQEALTIVLVRVAKVIGMELEAFDGSDEEIDENGVVIINGNGRMEYLSDIKIDLWPRLLATFVQPDRSNVINVKKAFAEMNLNNTKWTAQNMAQKRLLVDGNQLHEAWMKINSLLKDGYKYQSACQVATLAEDRIKANAADHGESDNIFKDYEDAMRVHEGVIRRFSNHEAIKGKLFTQRISRCWNRLRRMDGNAKATNQMLEFLNSITEDVVLQIHKAKNEINGLSKDLQRANLLETAFRDYCDENGLNI